jgi:hypothetical protein
MVSTQIWSKYNLHHIWSSHKLQIFMIRFCMLDIINEYILNNNNFNVNKFNRNNIC